jgi:uncharacterized protein with PIN domain
MIRAEFRFYGPLNDFLPAADRQRTVIRSYLVRTSVKDAAEGIGIPHTEIEFYVRDKEIVPADTLLRDLDRIAVYPWLSTPAGEPHFVLDGHLGRLAAYLRMLGFDTLYRTQIDDAELAATAESHDRILLTRDIGLLKRNSVRRGRWLRNTDPRQQAREIVEQFGLRPSFDPFTRCMHCNSELRPVDRAHIASRLPEKVAENFQDFRQCPSCERVYWPGSHYRRMENLIQWLREGEGQSPPDQPPEPSALH